MSLVVLVAVTGVVFLIADAVMLSTVLRPLFAHHLGDTLRDWHPAMVAADMAWGMTVTALSAWAGVMAARAAG